MTRTALLSALEDHRREFTARFDALPTEIVHARPSPKAWSLAQIADHIVRIDAELMLEGPPASRAARATSGVRGLVLNVGLSLPIRIPTPPGVPSIQPSADADWADVRERWAAVRAPWMRTTPDLEAVAFPHPYFGPLVWADALAFLLAHHRHHNAQIRRTLDGVRSSSTSRPDGV
ncbi:DinB family protein [Rubrivirga sp.]|uniref:DinB family protein n=1 Tax=Rubrivirga sp. TaxID=1885344 RepID=UPI003C71BA59